MELIINTEDKTIKIIAEKDTTIEALIKNLKATVKEEELKDYKIKNIK